MLKSSIPMLPGHSRGIGNFKNKHPDALTITASTPRISRASISMPGDSSRCTGNCKNKLPDAWRFQQMHRELQKQASRCLAIPVEAPEIARTSFSMPDDLSRGTGNYKNKLLDASLLQQMHRESQELASRCLAIPAEAPGILKTSFPMPKGSILDSIRITKSISAKFGSVIEYDYNNMNYEESL